MFFTENYDNNYCVHSVRRVIGTVGFITVRLKKLQDLYHEGYCLLFMEGENFKKFNYWHAHCVNEQNVDDSFIAAL